MSMFGGGYNSGYGGGGYGSSSSGPMMMGASSSSCLLLLSSVGVALYMMKDSLFKTTEPPNTDAVVDPDATVAPTNFNGSYVILVGTLAMNTSGACGKSKINFNSTTSTSKTTWKVNQAGTDPAGIAYYTMQSDFKSFNKICAKQYLTAPLNCKSGPYLDVAKSSQQQYWYIEGTAGNYQLRNVSCKLSRAANQYLVHSGSNKNAAPIFQARTGSAFSLMSPSMG